MLTGFCIGVSVALALVAFNKCIDVDAEQYRIKEYIEENTNEIIKLKKRVEILEEENMQRFNIMLPSENDDPEA